MSGVYRYGYVSAFSSSLHPCVALLGCFLFLGSFFCFPSMSVSVSVPCSVFLLAFPSVASARLTSSAFPLLSLTFVCGLVVVIFIFAFFLPFRLPPSTSSTSLLPPPPLPSPSPSPSPRPCIHAYPYRALRSPAVKQLGICDSAALVSARVGAALELSVVLVCVRLGAGDGMRSRGLRCTRSALLCFQCMSGVCWS